MSMKVEDKARLYRELAKMLGASFPLDRSIDMLADQGSGGARGEFLKAMSAGLALRKPFAEAMQDHARTFVSEMELGLVRAGEQSGRLAEACSHLARYFELWSKGIREARSAMIYPLVLLHVGVVLPEFSKSLIVGRVTGTDTHPVESILVRLAIFWAVLAALWLLWRTLSKAATTSEPVDRVLGMLPLVGSLRRHWAMARFCEVFHSTLLAAMNISECLRMAGAASQSGIVRAGAEAAVSRVQMGDTLNESLRATNRFPKLFVNSIQTAEASGGLDKEFARWAEAEAELAGETQKRVADWYPKALYFLVLGYVALRIVGFAADYFDTLNGLLK